MEDFPSSFQGIKNTQSKGLNYLIGIGKWYRLVICLIRTEDLEHKEQGNPASFPSATKGEKYYGNGIKLWTDNIKQILDAHVKHFSRKDKIRGARVFNCIADCFVPLEGRSTVHCSHKSRLSFLFNPVFAWHSISISKFMKRAQTSK